jgi:branched-chain amino acid transport system permease protein
MRAVADNQQVAMAMGINVERYFGVAWAMTGVVSALGGILWGNLLGVDVNLSLVGFKVFPRGAPGRARLDSRGGGGRLIVGIVENIAAGYIDPYVGGGTTDSFAPLCSDDPRPHDSPVRIFGQEDHREGVER